MVRWGGEKGGWHVCSQQYETLLNFSGAKKKRTMQNRKPKEDGFYSENFLNQ
jgi:hypothetical protein